MHAIAQKMRRPIVLVGFMGAGKSTVGPRLAERLAVPFVDLDAGIERATGETVESLFAGAGEVAFRRLESAALGVALAELARGGVIAGGGGLFAEPANRNRIAAGGALVAWLDTPLAEITQRLGGDRSRPLFQDAVAVDRLYRDRNAVYAAADVRVDASGADPEAVVDRLLAVLAERAGTPPPGSPGPPMD